MAIREYQILLPKRRQIHLMIGEDIDLVNDDFRAIQAWLDFNQPCLLTPEAEADED